MTYLAWQDTTKQPVVAKLADAIARYGEKHEGAVPTVCLCHPDEAAQLTAAGTSLEVRGVSFLPHHVLYVGLLDEGGEA